LLLSFLTMKAITLTIIFFISLNTSAGVNLLDGGLRFRIPIDNIIVATYNSRSVTRGALGIGWCSVFDEKLVIDQTRTFLEACGQRRVISKEELTETAAFYQINNKLYNSTGSFYGILRKNHSLMKLALSQIAIFENDNLKQLRIDKNVYHFNFSKTGNLTLILKNKTPIVQVTYEEGRDLVLSVKDDLKCISRYNYSSEKKINALLQTSTQITECPSMRPLKDTLRVWFEQDGNFWKMVRHERGT
jgi:hypothetical protein